MRIVVNIRDQGPEPNKIPDVALLLNRNCEADIFVLDKFIEFTLELTIKLDIVAEVNTAVLELITVFVIKVPTDKLVNTPLTTNNEPVLTEFANIELVVKFEFIIFGILLERADKEPFTSKV